MICTKEIDEIDFIVVNRRRTQEERAEGSRLISEAIALYGSLTAQGYSEEEVQMQLNARFAPFKKTPSPYRGLSPRGTEGDKVELIVSNIREALNQTNNIRKLRKKVNREDKKNKQT